VDVFALLLALIAPVSDLQALLAPDAIGKVCCLLCGSVVTEFVGYNKKAGWGTS